MIETETRTPRPVTDRSLHGSGTTIRATQAHAPRAMKRAELTRLRSTIIMTKIRGDHRQAPRPTSATSAVTVRGSHSSGARCRPTIVVEVSVHRHARPDVGGDRIDVAVGRDLTAIGNDVARVEGRNTDEPLSGRNR